ncbi:hypothetical protein LIER_26181 [Lithospermum erythrorhizon]|uniref:Uncharacterized protein n=1 Tax=Lithospermum erythrorhizon TaxID=34254 RepID=A0AAV3R7H0_LITER
MMQSVDDSMDKTVEPSNISEKCVDGDVDDNREGGDVDVSHVDNMVTEGVKMPSTENLVESVDPSVRDTLDELKDGTFIGGDVMSPSVIDTVNDPEVEGYVTRSVRDTAVESAKDLPEERSMLIVGQGVADTLNVDVKKLEILEDDGTSVINTGETIVEDIFEGRVIFRPNVIARVIVARVIVNEHDMKSVEINDLDVDTMSSAANSCVDDAKIPPPDSVLRFVDRTNTIAEETPREGETDSPNDTDVIPVIDSTEKKVYTDVRPSVSDLGETTVEVPIIESMPSVADTGDETIKRPSAEAMPDVIGSVVDNIDVTEVDLPNTIDVTQNQKKFKRRKH